MMPLLFVIAGYSSYAALSKRTPKQYMKERVLRLLVPLLFGLVLIVPPQGYMARLMDGFEGGYFRFLGEYFTSFSDLSGYTGYFNPAHLWFILYLFVISVVLLPVLTRMRRHAEKLKWMSRPWVLLICVVPVTAMQALPDIGGKNPFYFAAFFLLGAVIATSDVFISTLRRFKWLLLFGGLVSCAVFLTIAVLYGWPEGYNAAGISYALLRNLTVWMLTLGLMGLADAFINKPTKALSYFSRASYPVYLVHQTLLVVIAYFTVRSGLGPVPQYIVIMLGALTASVACYELCRRFRPTRFLLGIK